MEAVTEIEKNKAMPPRLGIFFSCELLCPGSSIRFLFLDILIMVGTEKYVIKREVKNDKIIFK